MDNRSSEVMPVSPVIFLKAGEVILSQFNKFYLTSLAALYFSNKNNDIPETRYWLVRTKLFLMPDFTLQKPPIAGTVNASGEMGSVGNAVMEAE